MSNTQQIDQNKQSRQLAVYGFETMAKLSTTRVLISGVNGLGIEIAKNVVLANVKSVTLHDSKTTDSLDLGAQFYLSAGDIGKNRATASLKRIQELNPSVQVEAVEGELTLDLVASHDVVVLIEAPLKQAIEIDEFCRTRSPRPIRFIRTDVNGLFGTLFCDFGRNFVVVDTNGEDVKTAIVSKISNDEQGLVTCVSDERIELYDGDWIQFTEVKGMDELNYNKERNNLFQIHNVKAYSFTIGDTSRFGKYISGGIATQVKIPATHDFKSLAEAQTNPGELPMYNFGKFDRPPVLHTAYRALDAFKDLHGSLPEPNNAARMEEVAKIALEIKPADQTLGDAELAIVRELARTARAVLNPMAAAFGGIVGQEVIKAATGKFTPFNSYLIFESLDSLSGQQLPASEYVLKGDRYDSQRAVFGNSFQENLNKLKYFMVGAGALGCEFMKNFAMMGVACGPEGMLTVTDDDRIELSNLTRQFLFRNYMIGQSKSAAAADVVKAMNPDMNVRALQERVSPQTENVFNDEFWTSLHGVCNALDNVKARLYVDSRCVFFGKPLLESGTLGPKCNVQVVLPHKTEHYGAQLDPPEKVAPECTLHNFPHNINHCLSWGRSEFVGNFDTIPKEVAEYVKLGSAEAYVKSKKEKGSSPPEVLQSLAHIKEFLSASCSSFNDCVAWARLAFEEYFHNRVAQLVSTFPEDAVTKTGTPFWAPPKRFPTVVKFSDQDSTHMTFIIAAANLVAKVRGIPVPADSRDPALFRSVLAGVKVPTFVPKSGAQIKTDEDDGEGSGAPAGDVDAEIADLMASMPAVTIASVNAEEFEKDDDDNHHMDFISSAANLRARNYVIGEVDKLQAKLIAGKIIPAIATATALATGLVCLELCKIMHSHPLEKFANSFVNLALPLVTQVEPTPPQKTVSRVEKNIPDPLNHPEYEEENEIKAYPEGFTAWDKLEINGGDMTVQEIIDFFKEKHGLSVSGVSMDVSEGKAISVYMPYMPGTLKNLPRKLTEIFEEASGRSLAGVPYILPTFLFQTEDGTDVETPVVIYRLKSIVA